jgi:hypothetical protein
VFLDHSRIVINLAEFLFLAQPRPQPRLRLGKVVEKPLQRCGRERGAFGAAALRSDESGRAGSP